MKAITPNDKARMRLMTKTIMDEYFEKHCTEIDTLFFFVLSYKFGFGKKRLRKFFDTYLNEIREMQDTYKECYIDKCNEYLLKKGVNIGEWEREIK